jgi:hypothetical protein
MYFRSYKSTDRTRIATIHYNFEWNEYQVKLTVSGTVITMATSYTKNRNTAIMTAIGMVANNA